MTPEAAIPPVPSGGAASAEPPAASIVLENDAPRVTGARVFYPEALAAYSERFGASEKTLKRWIARGRFADAAGEVPRNPLDLPPFHRPELLPAWCERRMDNRPPEWVLRVAHEAARSAPPAPAATPLPAPPLAKTPPADPPSPLPAIGAAAPTAPALRDFTAIVPLDFSGNVQQLRLSLATDQYLLDEAKLGTDDALIAKRQRAYRETYDLLRKSESDLVAWLAENGKLAPRDEVRAENTRIATSIFHAVLRLVRNIRPKLSGLTDHEQDVVWRDETVKCFLSLRDARFTDAAAVLAATPHEAALGSAA